MRAAVIALALGAALLPVMCSDQSVRWWLGSMSVRTEIMFDRLGGAR